MCLTLCKMLLLYVGLVAGSSLTRDAIVNDLGIFMDALRECDGDRGEERILSSLDRMKFHLASITHSGNSLSKRRAKQATRASLLSEQALDALDKAKQRKPEGAAEELTIDQVSGRQALTVARSNLHHAAALVALTCLHVVEDLVAPEIFKIWSDELEAVKPVYQPEELELLLETALARRMITQRLSLFMRHREGEVIGEMGAILSHVCAVPELLEIAWVKHDEFTKSIAYRDLVRLGPRLERCLITRNEAYIRVAEEVGDRFDSRSLKGALRDVEKLRRTAVRLKSGIHVKSMWEHLRSTGRTLSPFERWVASIKRLHEADIELDTIFDSFEQSVSSLLRPRKVRDQLVVAESAWLRSGAVLEKRKELSATVFQSLDKLSKARLVAARAGEKSDLRFTDPDTLQTCEALSDEHETALEIVKSTIEPIAAKIKESAEIQAALQGISDAEDQFKEAREYELRVCRHSQAVKQAKAAADEANKEVAMAVQMAHVIKSLRLALEAAEGCHEAYGRYLRAVRSIS